jgi:hypothetical protein
MRRKPDQPTQKQQPALNMNDQDSVSHHSKENSPPRENVQLLKSIEQTRHFEEPSGARNIGSNLHGMSSVDSKQSLGSRYVSVLPQSTMMHEKPKSISRLDDKRSMASDSVAQPFILHHSRHSNLSRQSRHSNV